MGNYGLYCQLDPIYYSSFKTVDYWDAMLAIGILKNHNIMGLPLISHELHQIRTSKVLGKPGKCDVVIAVQAVIDFI